MLRPLDIGLLTSASFPDLQQDYWLLRDELARRGYSVEAVIWDKANVCWEQISNVIICSVWDYHENYSRFYKWLTEREKQCNIINSPEIVRWNIDKSYLKHFEAAMIPVIPTVWLEHQSSLAENHHFQWQDVVVKPSVGASSSGMRRFDSELQGAALRDHIELLTNTSGVMIQPYLSSADKKGETALIYFNGRFSHAITRPLAGHQASPDVEVSEASYLEPGQEQLDIGAKVLACLPFSPAYIRVDLLTDNEENHVVLEVEMIEPSLFMRTHVRSAQSYSDALEESWIRRK
jgi:glutathione synthase/RimK-type ligase-like ATP-grasp enzyme